MSIVKNNLLLIPGVIFLFVVGLIGRYVGGFIPYVSYLIVCIFIGLIISNTCGLPALVEKGIKATHKAWLEAGIMVLGARVILKELVDMGPTLLLIVAFFLLFYLVVTQLLSNLFGLDERFGSTLACGLGVCGISAVTATGGALQIKPKDLAYIIGVVLVFDVFTVFAWPLAGNFFAMPSEIFGLWAGVSMLSTGTAVAAGFAHSDTAGELAAIAKMARNATIGIWALAFTAYYANKGLTQEVTNKTAYLWDKFPKFVLGFLAVMILSNIGILSAQQIISMENAYGWLFMAAFVGLGYDIKIGELRKTGIKPLIVASISVALVSVFSLSILYVLR